MDIRYSKIKIFKVLFTYILVKIIENLLKFFYLVGYFTKYRHRKINIKDIKRIWIICIKPLGIWDLIMDSVSIKNLKLNFPHSELVLITDKNVFWKNNIVNEVILLKGSFLSYIKQFYKYNKDFDLLVIMNKAVNQYILSFFIKYKFLIWYLFDWKVRWNFNLTNQLSFDKSSHYWDMSLNIIKALDLKIKDESLMDISFDENVTNKVDNFFSNLNIYKSGKKNIFISPFVLWPSRMLHPNKWIQLIKQIYKDFNIFLFWWNDAKTVGEYIKSNLFKDNIEIIDLIGKFSLKESIYSINFADLFVSADSGPMHFAFLMKKKVLAIFGPVDPLTRIPKNLKKWIDYDYIWVKDYIDKVEYTSYNYEFETINDKMIWLEKIPVEDIVKKVYSLI